MPTTCGIELESHPSNVVNSGEYLRGRIHLNLTKKKLISAINVTITGLERVHSPRDHDFVYKREISIYDNELTGIPDGMTVTLMPGPSRYTFETRIPDVPSTFEGKFGFVRYKIRVVVDVFRNANKEFEKVLTIFKTLDLNDDTSLNQPITAQKNEDRYAYTPPCRCNTSALKIIVRSPLRGYVPNQTINLKIIISDSNRSEQMISIPLTVQLIAQITYSAWLGIPDKVEAHAIAEVETRGCNFNRQNITNANIQVPCTAPPTDDNIDGVIKLRYFCHVIASIVCSHGNSLPIMPIIIPLTIGTKAIVDQPEQQPRPSAPLQVHEKSPSPNAPMPDDNPPTYEEAIT